MCVVCDLECVVVWHVLLYFAVFVCTFLFNICVSVFGLWLVCVALPGLCLVLFVCMWAWGFNVLACFVCELVCDGVWCGVVFCPCNYCMCLRVMYCVMLCGCGLRFCLCVFVDMVV